MTTARLQNVAIYVAIGVAILLAGALGQAVSAGNLPGFQDGQTFAGVRGQIGDLIALLATSGGIWLAANRPRQGSEGLAADVSALHDEGVHRADMTVISKEDAAWLARVKPLRDLAAADEALEKAGQRG